MSVPFPGWGGTPVSPLLGEGCIPTYQGVCSKIRAAGCWQCVEPSCDDYQGYLEGEFTFIFDHLNDQTYYATKRACLFCQRPQIFLTVYAEITLSEVGLPDLKNGKLLQMWKQAALEGRSYRRVEEV